MRILAPMPAEAISCIEAAPAVLGGLTIEQFAGVSAALAEPFPLEAVLANEAMTPREWPDADTAWKLELAKGGQFASLFESFQTKLAEAQDWLTRKVTPLDDDLGAWLGFLHSFASHARPVDWLEELGLGMNDIARLQRRWAKRMQSESIAKKAADIRKKGPGPMPKLTFEAAELRPFPWSKGATSATADHAEARDLAASPAHLAGTALLLDIPRGPALPFQPGEAAPEFAEPSAAQATAVRELSGTALAFDIPSGPVLPFKPDEAVPEFAEVSTAQAMTVRVSSETALALDIPPGPALPFQPGEAAPEFAQASVPQATAVREPSGTALALDVPRGPALPFVKAEPAGNAPDTGLKDWPPAKDLGATSPAFDVPQSPVLPFVKGALSALASGVPEAPAVKMAQPPEHAGGTALEVEIPRGPVLPFAKSGQTTQAEAPARTSPLGERSMGFSVPKNLPPPRRAQAHGAAPSPPAPPLTLEQHASLCVELVLAPEHTAGILARYRLTPESKLAVDQHYRERVAASPEIWDAWNKAYQTYYAWLVANRRPSR